MEKYYKCEKEQCIALLRVENRVGYYDCFHEIVHFHEIVSNPQPKGNWKEISSNEYADLLIDCIAKTKSEVMA